MKTLFLSIVLCFACAILVAAQNSNSNAQNAPASHTVQTVRGCLSKSGNTYIILGGTPLRQFRIESGDTTALHGKQGHTVEVTGRVGHVESGETTPPTPASTTGVGYDTIDVQSVKDVSPNCG
ncbi:MAG TPA: hypothetical protein VGS27_36180 [Candidatus Sulfotelmatobacter sp.]|nr:hypothetical protein [Candidatus Sulfotelmatobacter sp.]